jgi:phosphoribosylglycinamide formyltransferase-1
MLDAIFSPSLAKMRANRRQVVVAVLASGSGSNFEAIVEASRTGVLNAVIAIVVCNNPGAGVIERAARLGVPSVVVNHRDYGTRAEFDEAVVKVLRGVNAEWIVMAGWMRIATNALLAPFSERIVNLHPSLLPSFPGYDAIGQSLEARVGIVGCTAHIVSQELDSGPILAQAAIAVEEGETIEAVSARIHALEHRMYPRAVARAIRLGDGE